MSKYRTYDTKFGDGSGRRMLSYNWHLWTRKVGFSQTWSGHMKNSNAASVIIKDVSAVAQEHRARNPLRMVSILKPLELFDNLMVVAYVASPSNCSKQIYTTHAWRFAVSSLLILELANERTYGFSLWENKTSHTCRYHLIICVVYSKHPCYAVWIV